MPGHILWCNKRAFIPLKQCIWCPGFPFQSRINFRFYNFTLRIFNSYTTGTSGLPNIYTRSLRTAVPRAEGVYIRRTTSAHSITTYYVTLPCTNRAWASTKQLKSLFINDIAKFISPPLSFDLGLKSNGYTML